MSLPTPRSASEGFRPERRVGELPEQEALGSSQDAPTNPDPNPAIHIELAPVWIFWSLVAVLTFLNALINGVDFPVKLPPLAAFLGSAIDCALWALLTPFIFQLSHRVLSRRRQWPLMLLVLLVVGVVASLVVSRADNFLRLRIAAWLVPLDYQNVLSKPNVGQRPWQLFMFMSDFYAYMVVLAAGSAYSYLTRYRTQVEQAARLRVQLARAQVSALKSQLSPHFLFNTLNSIAALTEIDPPAARETIGQLSGLLRETLRPAEMEIPLAQELTLVRRYLDIMRTRYREQLQVVERIEPETLAALVPNFVLQPLLENAVKYCLEQRHDVAHIALSAARSGGQLVLCVEDNGPGRDAVGAERGSPAGFGLGLRGIEERLQFLYQDRQSIEMVRATAGGVTVTLRLPFSTTPGAESVDHGA